MIEFSIDKVRGAVTLDTRRSKENDLYPIKYRITSNHKQAYYRAGHDLTKQDWNDLERSKSRSLIRIKNLLKEGLKRFEEETEELVRGKGFSFDALNRRLGRGKIDTILEAIQRKIEVLKRDGRVNTANVYDATALNIRRFGPDKKFTELTHEWLKRFEAFMLKEGKSKVSVAIWMRSVKAVVNEFGNLSENQYPFSRNRYDKKFRIREGARRKIALTVEEIEKIMKVRLTEEDKLKARDLWFFSYLCNGCNMADLIRLKYKNINVRGREITFERKKTEFTTRLPKKITATLLPEMEQIIKKWGNPWKENNYIFPYMYEGANPAEEARICKAVTVFINNRMTPIGKKLKFGNITTYWSRHSFASVLKHSGTNIAFISEALGHSNQGVTENYLSSFESEERRKQANKLISKT